MRALIRQDLILSYTPDGAEIGIPPKGVGMERLRYDGAKIVDLADLTTMHVTCNGGVFVLHCTPVPGSQPVIMTYADRKNLVTEDGVFRVKTGAEITTEQTAVVKGMIKTGLRRSLDKGIGDTPDQMADVCKLLVLIITYLEGGAGAGEAKVAIDALSLAYNGVYDTAISKTTLLSNAEVLKAKMAEYYASIP